MIEVDLMKTKKPIIAVDFDGTITKTNKYPLIGDVQEDCKAVLKDLHNIGCVIILWTCRVSGKGLEEAVAFCRENDIPIDYVNENVPWIKEFAAPKIYADYYIDDRNIGGFIGWRKVREIIYDEMYTRYYA
ncbi:MAG: hydrolase [Clostridia bacterium]|nr:hydrolase [Clostridia bacterium]